MVAMEGRWLEALVDGEAKTATQIASITGAQPELISNGFPTCLAVTAKSYFTARIMLVLTATGVVRGHGSQEYKATPATRILMEAGWANGLKQFVVITFSPMKHNSD